MEKDRGTMDRRSARWCILRTGPSRTLSLARSLMEAGFEAWTPTDRVKRRVPRGDHQEWLSAPLMPSYVFVRERHIADLRDIERAEVSVHPRFSIWRHMGSTLWVRHATLHPLRAEQQARYLASLPRQPHAKTKAHGQPFYPGQRVKMMQGPFAGLTCEVDASDGRTTSLRVQLFGREIIMKEETSNLRSDRVATVTSAA